MEASDVQFDLEQFPQTDPSVTAARAKEREKAEAKERKRNRQPKQKSDQPTAAQIKQVEKMAEEAREQKTAEKKAELVRRIKRYFQRFPDKLKEADIKLPRGFGSKSSYDEVVALHHDVEMALHSGGNGEMLFTGLGFLVNGVEQMALSRGYTKLSGPNASLSATMHLQHDTLIDTLDELAIKYERWLATGPEKRLAMSLFMMTFMVVRANNASEAVREQQDEPLDETLQDDFIAAMRAGED